MAARAKAAYSASSGRTTVRTMLKRALISQASAANRKFHSLSCRAAILILNISDLSNKNAPYRFCTERLFFEKHGIYANCGENLLVLEVYYLICYHRVSCQFGGVEILFVHINGGYLMTVIGGVIVNALVGVAAACVYRYLILALGNFAAASLLVN